jgi:hypothetical protein
VEHDQFGHAPARQVVVSTALGAHDDSVETWDALRA